MGKRDIIEILKADKKTLEEDLAICKKELEEANEEWKKITDKSLTLMNNVDEKIKEAVERAVSAERSARTSITQDDLKDLRDELTATNLAKARLEKKLTERAEITPEKLENLTKERDELTERVNITENALNKLQDDLSKIEIAKKDAEANLKTERNKYEEITKKLTVAETQLAIVEEAKEQVEKDAKDAIAAKDKAEVELTTLTDKLAKAELAQNYAEGQHDELAMKFADNEAELAKRADINPIDLATERKQATDDLKKATDDLVAANSAKEAVERIKIEVETKLSEAETKLATYIDPTDPAALKSKKLVAQAELEIEQQAKKEMETKLDKVETKLRERGEISKNDLTVLREKLTKTEAAKTEAETKLSQRAEITPTDLANLRDKLVAEQLTKEQRDTAVGERNIMEGERNATLADLIDTRTEITELEATAEDLLHTLWEKEKQLENSQIECNNTIAERDARPNITIDVYNVLRDDLTAATNAKDVAERRVTDLNDRLVAATAAVDAAVANLAVETRTKDVALVAKTVAEEECNTARDAITVAQTRLGVTDLTTLPDLGGKTLAQILTAVGEKDAMEAARDAKETQLVAMETERDAAIAAKRTAEDNLATVRDDLFAANETKTQAEQTRDAMETQRNTAHTEITELETAAESLLQTLRDKENELQVEQNNHRNTADQLTIANRTIDTLTAERDTARAERNAMETQRDNAIADLDTRTTECDTAIGERDTARTERDARIDPANAADVRAAGISIGLVDPVTYRNTWTDPTNLVAVKAAGVAAGLLDLNATDKTAIKVAGLAAGLKAESFVDPKDYIAKTDIVMIKVLGKAAGLIDPTDNDYKTMQRERDDAIRERDSRPNITTENYQREKQEATTIKKQRDDQEKLTLEKIIQGLSLENLTENPTLSQVIDEIKKLLVRPNSLSVLTQTEQVETLQTELTRTQRIIVYLEKELKEKVSQTLFSEELQEIKKTDLERIKKDLKILINIRTVQQFQQAGNYQQLVVVRHQLIKDELDKNAQSYQQLNKKNSHLKQQFEQERWTWIFLLITSLSIVGALIIKLKRLKIIRKRGSVGKKNFRRVININ